jgi:hypothetical protein
MKPYVQVSLELSVSCHKRELDFLTCFSSKTLLKVSEKVLITINSIPVNAH